jgi:hypothetical protein
MRSLKLMITAPRVVSFWCLLVSSFILPSMLACPVSFLASVVVSFPFYFPVW